MNKNRIMALLLCLFQISTFFVAKASDETDVRYNLKYNLESDADFGLVFTYFGDANTLPARPTYSRSYANGKHGKGLQVIYPGTHLTGGPTHNSFTMQIKTSPLTNVGTRELTPLEYFREADSISFWAKAGIMEDRIDAYGTPVPAMANRKVELMIDIAGDKKYSKLINIPNKGEWIYYTIPFEELVKDGVTLKDGIHNPNATRVGSINFIFSHRDWYGLIDTGSGDNKRPAVKKIPEGEDWGTPFIIDEMLFNRSTPEKPAITPPSAGEESRYEDATLAGIEIDGRAIENFPSNQTVIEVPVPANYTKEDILEKVKPLVKSYEVKASTTQHPIAGATYELTAPATIPGDGSVRVRSASLLSMMNYKLKFVARQPFQVLYEKISDIDFTEGLKYVSVPVKNEGSEIIPEATAIMLLRNKLDGSVSDIEYENMTNLNPDTTYTAEQPLSFPENADMYNLELYFVDNLKNLNLLFSPLSLPENNIKYNKISGTIKNKTVRYDTTSKLFTIKGTTLNCNDGENIVVSVENEGDEGISDFILIPVKNNTFEYTMKTELYGKFDFSFNSVNSLSSVYRPSDTEMADCIRDFELLNSQSYTDFYENYKDVLNLPIDLEGSFSISEVIKNSVATGLKFNEIQAAIQNEIVFSAIKHSLEAAKKVFINYNDIAKLDDTKSFFIDYINTDAKIEKVLSLLQKSKATDMIALRKEFLEISLIEAISSIGSYGEIEPLVMDNSDIIGNNFNYVSYNQLTTKQKTDFWIYVSKNTVTKLSDLNSLLTSFINSLKVTTPVINTPSGSRGGGGTPTAKLTFAETKEEEPEPTEAPKIEPVEIFTDLSDYEWAKSAIYELKKANIITGKTEDKFAPELPILREEFIKLIVSVFNLESTGIPAQFSDVSSDKWYYNYISIAAENGIANGMSENVFGIGENIKRQDMAVLLCRALEKKRYTLSFDDTEMFTDNENISDYAVDSVYKMKVAGFINGMEDGSFMPAKTATRAEAAKLMYNIYTYLNQN